MVYHKLSEHSFRSVKVSEASSTELTEELAPNSLWLRRLVLLLLTLVTNNVEELEGVLALVGADDTEPVTELLLLQKLLGQVLEVAAGELLVGDDLDAAIAEVGDVDGVAEVAGQTVDLDALLQEGGEGGRVEDAVLGRLGGVDHELYHCAEPVSNSFSGPGIFHRYGGTREESLPSW